MRFAKNYYSLRSLLRAQATFDVFGVIKFAHLRICCFKFAVEIIFEGLQRKALPHSNFS